MNLRIPGPTPCPEDVLLAGAQQMIDHRGPEFADIIARVHSGLQTIFATKNDVAILTSSGTGAMEAAVVNTLSRGDRVINVSIGVFGDRFGQIAEAYGAEVVKMSVEHGTPADPDAIGAALAGDPAIKAVLVTHNETSTGVTNDIGAIARAVRAHDRLLLVDAISSVGCIPVATDAWDLDVVVTGSQKGFMVPPGLAFAAVGPRAREAAKTATMPRFYFDFEKHFSYFQQGQTPWTPAVSVMFSLDLAVQKLLADGMESVYTKHAKIASDVRAGVKALGLELLVQDEAYASNTVTAVKVPEGVELSKLRGLMRTERNVVMAGGQGPLSNSIFRIGHMGYITEDDVADVMDSLAAVLPQVGFPVAV
ncbi:MAG: alanine--glyoxylate aminotransferase family protein [Chloroflexota bacterium]|nr:alanine--glyoxylate aminotransferase family protein [Chloroflexota bacterium]